MSEEKKYSSLPTGALILIFVGVVFLLNNFGVIPWSIWNYLWKLWPLILVFMGLEAFFGSSREGNTILFVLVLLVLIYIFLTITGNLSNLPIKLPFPTPTPNVKPLPYMYRFNY